MNNEKIITNFNNLYRAFKTSKNRRSYKDSAMYFQLNAVSELEKLQNELTNHTYKISGYTSFVVYYPKERTIMACKFRDKIVQHVLCDNILASQLSDICIKDNYAGQKGKGTGLARDRLIQKMSMFEFSNGTNGYFYKGDIHKYYYNIRHSEAIDIMEYYYDEDTHWLIEKFIHSTEGDVGLALGNQINTIVSNLYLDGFDKFITGELGIRYYGRYADDFYLIHENKEYLSYCVKCIEQFLDTLGLSLNPKSQIIPYKNGISFLGFHFYSNGRIALDNAKKRAYRRKFNKLYKKVSSGELSFHKIKISYKSWYEHAKIVTDQSIFNYYNKKLEELKNDN